MWRTISYRVFRAERGAERRARTESLGRAEDEQFLCDATLARWLRRSALLHTLMCVPQTTVCYLFTADAPNSVLQGRRADQLVPWGPRPTRLHHSARPSAED